MAQRTKTAAAKSKPMTGRRLGRPPGSKNKPRAPLNNVAKRPTRTASEQQTAPTRKAMAPLAVTKPSKEELRLQVEKLDRTVATLRARSREAVRAAKLAAARIEELEDQLRGQQKQARRPAAGTPRGGKKPALAEAGLPKAAVRTPRGRAKSVKQSPGDAVRPGVADEKPTAMDV